MIQFGFLFSKNALIPSIDSGFSHTSASASTVNLIVSSSILADKFLTRFFEADTAEGPLTRKK